MRIFNVLRNSLYSLVSFAMVALLGIVVRKYFTMYLAVELLGVEGLFANIMAMLSLAEMGLTSVVSYGLYRELAHNNRQEINILMNIYRYIYSIIGTAIVILGFIIYFFLPWIIKDVDISWSYVEFVYFVQIATLFISYFLAYKRVIFAADQRDYMVLKIDTCCNSLRNIGQLVAIIIFQDYILYCAIALVCTFGANLIVSYRMKRDYPYVLIRKVSFTEIKERNVFKDVKNILIQRIAGFVYGGTGAMILSSICGLTVTGMFANYQLLDKGLFSIMYRVLQGIVPSIGNLVNGNDKTKSLTIYYMLDFSYMLLGGYIGCIYVIAIQPFVRLFFGNNFLLPFSLVIVWSLYVFIMIQFENACNFRSTQGYYDYDRKYVIYSAVTQLLFGIPFTYLYGVTGLMLAGIFSWAFIGYGRIKLVFNIIFDHISIKSYLLKHLYWSVITIVEVGIIYVILERFNYPEELWQIGVNCIAAFIIMGIFQTAVFHKTNEFCLFVEYFQKTLGIVQQKFKRKADIL